MRLTKTAVFFTLLLAVGFVFFIPGCDTSRPPVIPATALVPTPDPCTGILGHNTIETTVPGAGNIWFDPYVQSTNGTMMSLSVYCASATPVTYEAGIYSDISASPWQRLSETGPVTLSAPATQWHTVPLKTNLVLSAGVTYWLALGYNTSTFRFGPGASTFAYQSGVTFGTLPATASATAGGSVNSLSLYGTFCP